MIVIAEAAFAVRPKKGTNRARPINTILSDASAVAISSGVAATVTGDAMRDLSR